MIKNSLIALAKVNQENTANEKVNPSCCHTWDLKE